MGGSSRRTSIRFSLELPWQSHYDKLHRALSANLWLSKEGWVDIRTMPDLQVWATINWMRRYHCTDTPYMIIETYRRLLRMVRASWSYKRFIQPQQQVNDVAFAMLYNREDTDVF